MKTRGEKLLYLQVGFWAAMLVFVLFLLYRQSAADMRLISLPGLFLSLGMLSFLAREFCPTRERWRRFLFAIAIVCVVLSLAVSARLVVSR